MSGFAYGRGAGTGRAVGDSVIVFGTVRGRHDSGPVSRRAVWTWRVEDGLATCVRVSDVGGA